MADFEEKFNEFWKQTEVIREYKGMLHTFGDTKLPYVLLAEHKHFSDRTAVTKGTLIVQKPSILLPGYYNGPEFKEGFEHSEDMPKQAAMILRSLRLPYSNVTNRLAVQEQIEYGSLSEVIEKFEEKFEQEDDQQTGLIKTVTGGFEVALMRYALGLIIKSGPDNVKHYFEHIRKQNKTPIQPNETITDEEIRRLFE